MYPCEQCGLPRDGKSAADNSGPHNCIRMLKLDRLRPALLRPFTGTGAVFFPIGRPPQGTCAFATEQCLKQCYAAMPKYPNFDEELRVSAEDKVVVRRVILNRPIEEVVGRICADLRGLQTPILHWFASGDCIPRDTDRIVQVIDAIDDCGIEQMGFTRNERLWAIRPDVFALTVESREDVRDEGRCSLADYEAGTATMYLDGKRARGGSCGPELCVDLDDANLSHFLNCRACLRLKTGCFFSAPACLPA